jgi:hypothetical protein
MLFVCIICIKIYLHLFAFSPFMSFRNSTKFCEEIFHPFLFWDRAGFLKNIFNLIMQI